MGRADSEQASPGLRQDEAGGSIADSECVTGLAGLKFGTECGKNVEDKTFGTFGNNLDLIEKTKLLKCVPSGNNVCIECVNGVTECGMTTPTPKSHLERKKRYKKMLLKLK